MKIPAFVLVRIKAVAALVVAAVVTYVGSAIVSGQVWTVHGLEVAAATALLTALGVHQAPANRTARLVKKAVPAGGLHYTITADASQMIAELKAVTAQAERASTAVKKATPRKKS